MDLHIMEVLAKAMPRSIYGPEVKNALDKAREIKTKLLFVDNQQKEVPSPFPSPQDWRDQWIYFIMVDRFNNPEEPPRRQWNKDVGEFQGGTFEGIRQQLGYLKQLGVGALWLTPVLKNCQYLNGKPAEGTYHGYGIQDFLQIDPRFASNQDDPEGELQALIDEAHAREIYVIFDIVLNHAGDVFDYPKNAYVRDEKGNAYVPYRDEVYEINWRDKDGNPDPDWQNPPSDDNLEADAAIWPKELRNNDFFRRKSTRKDTEYGGDFASLREFVSDNPEVRNILILVHQYLIAKYDIDGFRIDTLKHIEPDFAQIFGNAMREFALSIGKKNFFTFGEVADEEEEKLARFIGRRALEPGDLTGVDAALDFPLFHKLSQAAKGTISPLEVVNIYERRKEVQRGIVSSHGEASRFFVTFLDNHDQHNRFYYREPHTRYLDTPSKYDDQATLGIACLFSLQGIPCLYYGTEQGLHGSGSSDQSVREALWGKPDAFNRNQPFYQTTEKLSHIRDRYPALRYGRQYFRPISGDEINFGISTLSPGVLAFSRILNDQEMVVVANTNTESDESIFVLVDYNLNSKNPTYKVVYTNKSKFPPPYRVEEKQGVTIRESNGKINNGFIRTLKVTLQPMEVQILAKEE
jgi:glycosidase